MTLTLPPELERALAEHARAQNTTPELLVVDSLQEWFALPAPPEHVPMETLYDFLQGYAGTVDGTGSTKVFVTVP